MKFRLIIPILFILLLQSPSLTAQHQYTVNGRIDTTLLDFHKLFPFYNDSESRALLESVPILKDTNEMKIVEAHTKADIAIIYFYENDSLIKPHDSTLSGIDYAAATCLGNYYSDTLHLSVSIGFFGGMGVAIKMTKNGFNGYYFQDVNGEPVFKKHLSDKNYSSQIVVNATNEKLTLNTQPNFKNNEILVGEYEGTFEPFYEESGKQDLAKKFRVKTTFKCMIHSLQSTKFK